MVKTSAKKKDKDQTSKVTTSDKTLILFEKGRSIQEFADERVLKEETIYNHLSRLIKDEKIEVDAVLDQEKLELLKEKLGKEIEGTLSEAKEKVGKTISWEELKVYHASILK